VLVCLLKFVCPVGGLSVWAIVVTIVGSCVVARLYMGKSLSAQLISVLLAWSMQLLIGSHCHVTCWVMVSSVNAMATCWAWPCPNVGSRIHFVNGNRWQMALQLCWAAFGSMATVIPWPAQFWSIAWKNEHSSYSGWESCIRTLHSVHLVKNSLSICSKNLWSRVQTLLFITSVISLQNVACFCSSWSKPSRFFY